MQADFTCLLFRARPLVAKERAAGAKPCILTGNRSCSTAFSRSRQCPMYKMFCTIHPLHQAVRIAHPHEANRVLNIPCVTVCIHFYIGNGRDMPNLWYPYAASHVSGVNIARSKTDHMPCQHIWQQCTTALCFSHKTTAVLRTDHMPLLPLMQKKSGAE